MFQLGLDDSDTGLPAMRPYEKKIISLVLKLG
jgi:hypothetical protein